MAWLASALVAGISIIVVLPITVGAGYLLIPNAAELVDRILYRPIAPRGSLAFMLLVQVAVIGLTAMTFFSYVYDRVGRRPRNIKTRALGGATLVVSVFAYWYVAEILSAFPD